MSKKVSSRSPGSIVLEVIIVVLIVVLIVAINNPKKQWKNQNINRGICQERMGNLFHASKYYHQVNKSYTDNIDELIHFAQSGSLSVYKAGFKMDRLTREDSGIDSFLIDYFDPYQLFSHYEEEISFNYPDDNNSVIISIIPKDRFKFLPSIEYSFTADQKINCRVDDRGEQGVFLLVGSQGRMQGQYLNPELIRVPDMVKASDYLFQFDSENTGNCVSTETPFEVNVNVKIAIQAEMECFITEVPSDSSLLSSELLSSIVIFNWLKEADSRANSVLIQEKIFELIEDSLVKAGNSAFLDSVSSVFRENGKDALSDAIYDTTLEGHTLETEDIQTWEDILESSYSLMNELKSDNNLQKKRDDLVNLLKNALALENLQNKMQTIEESGQIIVSESGIISTIADSIEYYSSGELIKDRLFKSKQDSVTTSYLYRSDIRELLGKFYYEESYSVGRVDSIGKTIKCPIEERFTSEKRTLLDKIFAVKGETNHGKIENGDMSWDERR